MDIQSRLLTLLAEKPRYGYETEGGRTRYVITDAGRQHQEARQSAEPTRGRHGSRDSNGLWLARGTLRSVLRANKGASAEEQQRIMGILQRATADILSTTGN